MAALGLQTFIPTVLGSVYGVSLALATSTLTAYLLGGAAGIFAGGFLAARTSRHDRVAAGGMLLAALVLALVVAMGAVPAPLLLPVFVLIGFALGATGPSRDLIVRAATPKGAAGRVYGFVYSGLDLGGIIGPVAFGFLLDHGHPQAMLVGVAALLPGRDRHGHPGAYAHRRGARRSPGRSPRDERPPRSLRSLPPEGAPSALRAAGAGADHGSRHRRQTGARLRGEQGIGTRLRARRSRTPAAT